MIAVCTYNKRPMTQGPRSYMLKTGAAAWGRDPYHLLDGEGPLGEDSRTLCGRPAYGWCLIGPLEELNHDCCLRCRKVEEANV